MDETAAPWRALESGPPGPAGPAPGGPSSVRMGPGQVATLAAIAAAGVIGLAAIWLVAGSARGSVVVDGDRPASAASALPGNGPGTSSVDRGPLLVDVQGAVVRPGVVRLAAGSRVGDAIAAAGGFGPRVASDRVANALNLAAIVHDGDQLIVPSRDDPSPGAGGGTAAPPGGAGGGAGEPVDLNHASAEALDALPGIGPATAAKIIAAREEQPFTSVDDLKTRKIVGAATFEKLRALVTVR